MLGATLKSVSLSKKGKQCIGCHSVTASPSWDFVNATSVGIIVGCW
jgi:hypothetical protein